MATNSNHASVVTSYEYPEDPNRVSADWSGLSCFAQSAEERALDPGRLPEPESSRQGAALDVPEIQGRLQERFEAGRQLGIGEGRKAEHDLWATRVQAESERHRQQLAELVRRFDSSCSQYLHEVEKEVVALALAIAARILRRESQMDPLLLTGAVRVALGQLSKTTQVRLRVPQVDSALWTEAIAHLPNLAVRPEIVADTELHSGDCLVETDLGGTDLGLRSQLAEIERGFFDRPSHAHETANQSGEDAR